jgi:hypothetical protein
MADGFGAEQAVHRTACSWVRWPAVLGEEPARLPVDLCETHSDPWRRLGPAVRVSAVDDGAASPARYRVAEVFGYPSRAR